MRGVVIDAPDLASHADVVAYLKSLGVDPAHLRVDAFREPTRLGTRIRIIDESGENAPYLPEIDDGAVVVLRPDQIEARAASVSANV